jgi:hypothetical protein
MKISIGRRKLITALGCAIVAWPLAARAQQAENIAKIGVLYPGGSAPAPPRMESIRKGLRQLGMLKVRTSQSSFATLREVFNSFPTSLPSWSD